MKNLYKALADFQSDAPSIPKAKQGYGYNYAPLDGTEELIRPVLKKHGLSYTQLLEDNKVITHLFHIESGEKLVSSMTLPEGVTLAKMNAFQVIGSGISYFRRYQLEAILGLVTSDPEQIKPQVKSPQQSKPTAKKVFSEADVKTKISAAKTMDELTAVFNSLTGKFDKAKLSAMAGKRKQELYAKSK